MIPRRILITGATGRIGHVIAETLIQETDCILYLLVRDPTRLRLDPHSRSGITLLPGDLAGIRQHACILREVDAAILAAARWVSSDAFDINVTQTLGLLGLLDPSVCTQVLYFSTASVLDHNNRLLKEAGERGTSYVRSKVECLRRLPDLSIASKTTVLFPTLVVGGDAAHPDPDFGSALPRSLRWLWVVRFLSIDGSFHFIHVRDLVRVVRHLLEHPPAAPALRYLVLGQPPLTVNQAIAEVCAYLGRSIPFRIAVGPPVLRLAAGALGIATPRAERPWTQFCLTYRHFTYQDVVNPASLGLSTYCPTVSDVLRIYGIPRAGDPVRHVSGPSSGSR